MKLTTIIYNWKQAHYTVASLMTTDAADWQNGILQTNIINQYIISSSI